MAGYSYFGYIYFHFTVAYFFPAKIQLTKVGWPLTYQVFPGFFSFR